jgi:hypothetical protein
MALPFDLETNSWFLGHIGVTGLEYRLPRNTSVILDSFIALRCGLTNSEGDKTGENQETKPVCSLGCAV